MLGAASLAGASAVAAWLPPGRRRILVPPNLGTLPSFPYQVQGLFPQPTVDCHLCRRLQRVVLAGGRLYLDHVPSQRRAVSALYHRPQLAVLCLFDRPRRHPRRRFSNHKGRSACGHWWRHLLLYCRRAAHPVPIALDCNSGIDHAFERRLHFPDRLAKLPFALPPPLEHG